MMLISFPTDKMASQTYLGSSRFRVVDHLLIAPALAIAWNPCLVRGNELVEFIQSLAAFLHDVSIHLFVVQKSQGVFGPVASTKRRAIQVGTTC